MLKLQLFLIPLLNLICLIFVPLPDGWCYSIDHSENTPLLIRENAPPSTGQTAYTIQDNLHLFSKPDPSTPLLLPASDNFIAADTINSNLPIFSQFRNPANLSKDPFANSLYANLRVKKLLNDYAETQKRARELLGSSYRSGTINLMTGNSTYQLKTTLPRNNNLKNNASLPDTNQLQETLSSATTAKSFGVYAALNNRANTQNSKNIASLHELQTTRNLQGNLISAPLRTAGSYVPSGSNPSYYQQPQSSPNLPSEEHEDRTSYETSGNFSFLFKILALPTKLFDFAMKHSVTTLVTGILFLFFLSLLFGSRS